MIMHISNIINEDDLADLLGLSPKPIPKELARKISLGSAGEPNHQKQPKLPPMNPGRPRLGTKPESYWREVERVSKSHPELLRAVDLVKQLYSEILSKE